MEVGSSDGMGPSLIGQMVFFFHPIRAWELAVVASMEEQHDGKMATVRCKSGETFSVPVNADFLFLPTTPGVFDSFPDDLLEMPELHDALLLHVLRNRHARDLTYMRIGEMVLSVNPFKVIASQADNCMELYLDHLDTAKLPSGLPPHVWSVAHRAYVEMRARQANHSIIASGESGSGKTEACKKMLKYLCAASERVATDVAVSQRMQRISEKVQMSSVVMESFGNAKTVKNDNSSRFGKFMEVQFDADGVMMGLRVTPFLLERSRAVTCGADERVYHVFYQLVAGADGAMRERLRLGDARSFVLLGKGGCLSLKNNGIDDARDFQVLQAALTSIGFSEEEQDTLWSIVGSILHLQNITFEMRRIDDSALLSDGDAQTAAFVAGQLLLLPEPEAFVECLTTSTVVVGRDCLTKKLSVQKAGDQRNSICKFLYSKLFLFVIQKINAATLSSADFGQYESSPTGVDRLPPFSHREPTTWIALLDIFGFEDFQVNSLEQFCINLANEALQRQYTEKMFLLDMEEMRAEGVEPNITEFVDNQLCLVLLQGSKNSIISHLDDASLLDVERSRTNPDFVFLNSVTSAFFPDYQSAPGKKTRSVLDREKKMDNPSAYFYRGRLDDSSFTIRHYAGDVKYCINGFVEKNNDYVKDSCAQTMHDTTSWVLRGIIGTKDEMVGLMSDTYSPGSPTSPLRGSRCTVVSNFRHSLRLLMEMLTSSVCNWVRCIRPHSRRQAGLFDGKLVLEQLVATGVLSTLKQRQTNYPFRLKCKEFAHNYHILLQSRKSLGTKMTVKAKCLALLRAAGIREKSAQLGTSRVFLSTDAHRMLESRRVQIAKTMVTVVERYVAAFVSRAYVRLMLVSRHTLKLQRIFRVHMRIRRCVSQYYGELRRKRYERFLESTKLFLRAETNSRVELIKERESDVRTLWSEFRTRLVPLVEGVLRNVKAVEAKQRDSLISQSFSCYVAFRDAFVREAAVALEREKQRIAIKRERDASERSELLCTALVALQAVAAEEASTFQQLHDNVIAPMVKRLKAKARAIRRAKRWRDRRLQELYDARASELRRLAVVEAEELRREEERWRRLVGEEEYLNEMRYFCSFSDDTYGASPLFRAFLRDGVPSEVLHTPIDTSPRKSSSIGGVTSFRDYRNYMRDEFHRARINGTTPNYRPHKHREEVSCELCNFLLYPSRNNVATRPSVESLMEDTTRRRLDDEYGESDDSFDELHYERKVSDL
ncbi:myosin heavy chain, putative [Trypanosoma cruzi]|uniref:Myosin heavy chain, putative n=1 Tax=Trypanosoma cruzi (strain CL Brener) TaxID=353153 RepID=Q4DE20_TRYCC|nr:myosin heavy chain, putative [Trypanosoma cruzi]EAN90766.1 myosin heavy chain, putative [Trypanosoma cruzi]|eukprot:XP_812617.1 myosin heavy chain [Trypanosoma cruzi strain CL Brener]